MTSKSVATPLADLGVTRSHSRPSVSNDNPYSESLFKTMKYAPVFPDRFASIGEVRAFMDRFVTAYNHEHHHTGIGLHPRRRPLRPCRDHPRRPVSSAHGNPPHALFTSSTDPKILATPCQAWIDQPAEPAA